MQIKLWWNCKVEKISFKESNEKDRKIFVQKYLISMQRMEYPETDFFRILFEVCMGLSRNANGSFQILSEDISPFFETFYIMTSTVDVT